MGLLPDRLFRRTIELFLLAGDRNAAGSLPDIEQIAWRLRVNQDQLDNEMTELERVGILAHNDSGWIVAKFSERQSPVDGATRIKQYRERQQKQQYYDSVTTGVTNSVTSRYVDTDTDTEENRYRGDTEKSQNLVVSPSCFAEYEQNIGALTPAIAGQLDTMIEDYTDAWVCDAITRATQAEKRSLSYVVGILRNWKRDGRTNGKVGQAGKTNDEIIQEGLDEWAKIKSSKQS